MCVSSSLKSGGDVYQERGVFVDLLWLLKWLSSFVEDNQEWIESSLNNAFVAPMESISLRLIRVVV